MRCVAARGLAWTKLADVAAEAGVSVGLIQSYFRSKDDLLRFGVQHLYDRTKERIENTADERPIRALLLRVLQALLPLDDERRAEIAVWVEFIPASLHDEDMGTRQVTATTEAINGLEAILTAASDAGELPAVRDVRREAAALWVFVDGLAMHQLATPGIYDDETARALITHAVDRLFDTERDTS